jgi:hypothetical protein
LISLVSAKGSPGVTTTAAALVGMASDPSRPELVGPAVLVELDPAGGDIDVLCGARSGASSLLGAATDLRRGLDPDVLAGHVVEAVPGVPGLSAPTPSHAARAVIESVDGRLGAELARAGAWVLVDAGRWAPGQTSVGRVEGSALVGVVCRSTAVSVAHARDLVPALRAVCESVVVVLVGEEPYGRADVAEVLDVAVVGPLAWDPRGVSDLWRSGATDRWCNRGRLARSARHVLAELAALVDPEPYTAPGPDSEPAAWSLAALLDLDHADRKGMTR